MKEIKIGRRRIGESQPPFIIAEMSGNHNQSLTRALAIVDAAAKAGAHALKIQTYTADTMTLNIRQREFVVRDKKSLWRGRSLFDLYQQAATPWEWHKAIFDRCKRRGIIGFSTPFDASAVDFLETLKVPCYKIASFELVDLPLIRRVAATRKPLILSTGMATAAEIGEAVASAKEAGARDIILLKCTSSYPAPPENSNLATLKDMTKRFHCPAGVSDHTLGLGVALAGVAYGAVVIEKHFTIKRAAGGVDSAFSMEPAEMAALVSESERAWSSIGSVSYGRTGQEKNSLVFRRSLYIVRDLKKGQRITAQDIRSIRPNHGLPPKYYGRLIGRKVARDVRQGTPVRWHLIGRG